jgi:hypothetical protein
MVQPHRGDSAALAVAAIAHLDQGLEQVSPADLFGTGDPDHAAAALGGFLLRGDLISSGV